MTCGTTVTKHDDVIKWKHSPRYWPFVRGNSPHIGPVTRSFDVFFDLRLIKRSWVWWFETPSRSLWRHCYGQKMKTLNSRQHLISYQYIEYFRKIRGSLYFSGNAPLKIGCIYQAIIWLSKHWETVYFDHSCSVGNLYDIRSFYNGFLKYFLSFCRPRGHDLMEIKMCSFNYKTFYVSFSSPCRFALCEWTFI